MRRLSRDTWILGGLLLVLIALTSAATLSQIQEQEAPDLAATSTAESGARALWLWLRRLGFETGDEVGPDFAIPGGTAVMFMLEPLAFPGISDAEWEIIDGFVEQGGTLILAGSSAGSGIAIGHYDFSLRYAQVEVLRPLSPALSSPPARQGVSVRTSAYLLGESLDFTPLLAFESGPVVVSLSLGAGRVVLSTASFPFSNLGIGEPGNAEFILNLLGDLEPGARIWFDEWHHGKRTLQAQNLGPGGWLRYTPAGRSLLFVAAAVFFSLLIAGRRFGRPVSVRRETPRRTPLDYVTAIANLSRRAGHRDAVLTAYRNRLKRHFGQRYRLDPRLADDVFLERLARDAPHLEIGRLQGLLENLARSRISEREMVRLAIQTAEFLRQHENERQAW